MAKLALVSPRQPRANTQLAPVMEINKIYICLSRRDKGGMGPGRGRKWDGFAEFNATPYSGRHSGRVK